MERRIWTIGYGNGDLEHLLFRLRAQGIRRLYDVRSTPYSRYQKQFDREVLDSALSETEIAYRYAGHVLGGAQFDAICAPTEAATQAIAKLSEKEETSCLMCGCGFPIPCHRGRAIAPLLIARGLDVWHILPDGRTASHAQYAREVNCGQGDLFASDAPT